MKKFVYLCGMMLLCMNMMAQIDLNDRNWENVLDEQFDEDSSYWLWDHESFLNLGDHSWMGYLGGNLAPPGEYEIYQFNNCQISTIDNTMRLVAYYDSANIHQNNYYLPKWMWPEYNGSGYPPNGNKLYFSGAIEYYKKRYVQNEDERKFLYGYFEIRCKLPTHQGAFPAFWLHGANKSNTNPYYEEIDIFEYGWWITSPSGINPNPPGLGSNITSSTDEPIIIRNNDKTTFRVTDSFEILGSFEVTSEAEFTVITQSCPTLNRTLKR